MPLKALAVSSFFDDDFDLIASSSIPDETRHACHLAFDGQVYCWGVLANCQLGPLGKEYEPNAIDDFRPAIGVATTWATSCALDAYGVVRCTLEAQEPPCALTTKELDL